MWHDEATRESELFALECPAGGVSVEPEAGEEICVSPGENATRHISTPQLDAAITDPDFFVQTRGPARAARAAAQGSERIHRDSGACRLRRACPTHSRPGPFVINHSRLRQAIGSSRSGNVMSSTVMPSRLHSQPHAVLRSVRKAAILPGPPMNGPRAAIGGVLAGPHQAPLHAARRGQQRLGHRPMRDFHAKIHDQQTIRSLRLRPAQQQGVLSEHRAIESIAALLLQHRVIAPQRQQGQRAAGARGCRAGIHPVELAAHEGGFRSRIRQCRATIRGSGAGKLRQ